MEVFRCGVCLQEWKWLHVHVMPAAWAPAIHAGRLVAEYGQSSMLSLSADHCAAEHGGVRTAPGLPEQPAQPGPSAARGTHTGELLTAVAAASVVEVQSMYPCVLMRVPPSVGRNSYPYSDSRGAQACENYSMAGLHYREQTSD